MYGSKYRTLTRIPGVALNFMLSCDFFHCQFKKSSWRAPRGHEGDYGIECDVVNCVKRIFCIKI